MSIITDLKAKVGAAPALPDLKLMLSQAEDALAILQTQFGELSLAAISDPAGQKALDEHKRQVASQQDRILMLRAALATAERQAEELIVAQRRALQRSQFASCAKYLDLRDNAAAAYEKAIAEATRQYRAMQTHSVKAQQACPLMLEWPNSTRDENAIMLLARGEGWKHVTPPEHGRPANWDGYALPGMSAGDAAYIENPAATPSISEVLARESADIKAVLKGKLIP